ncbi:NAC domain-containing protein 82-like isoform X1 [Carya illinoinensis]|uniref:NAC domain-containing protein n=1 Tax=Carya illinoinensis TaxID=32201 RepID=A0A8T1QS90_CARIL|nr:NAC domain-containing protein 82-like isoform X1 [Carya illinoinensis]XP_042976034.1 NAC domain-containing protein 82-like isoform X1 [Carya illinoinensis]XP_042976035.1 NAC domain-containing protein 82-like isoform X1 [Carya illinoinensis]XP_042976036.1 NAC domain-containing protein 82-like isoform X1 [Carya illinoinensis]KAG6657336.1 hypothetical protein CIPAW_04G083400 [Carya illinoinensis]KAG6657337.1 hypothetical protein CIPAW_04G083400 [Carya illinoinensis]KAG6657338.1 hypothetical p
MGTMSHRQPGYRFHPTDIELVVFYLKLKFSMISFHPQEIAEVNIYKFAPWELPEKSISQSGDLKWYFFCPVEKKYANGLRMNRKTEFGYWKSTGKCKLVRHNEVLVGSRKTLIFHRTSEKQRARTDWVMHEYSLEYKNLAKEKDVQNKYVLCKIFQKEGRGPRNGAQYGAPFKEEDWSGWSDVSGVEVADCAEDVTLATSSTPTFMLPNNNINSAAIGTTSLGGTISESCLSLTVPSQCEGVSDVPHNNVTSQLYQALPGDILPTVLPDNEDEISSMFDYYLAEGNTVILSGDENNKNLSSDEIDHEDPFYHELINTIIWDWDNTAGPSVDGNVQEASVHQEDRIYMKDLESPLDS